MTDIVDRLQQTNDAMLVVGQDYSDVLLDAAVEIERLNLQRRELVEVVEGHVAAILELHAQIDRLRGLLHGAVRIDEGDFSVNVDEWMQRVREALGDVPEPG